MAQPVFFLKSKWIAWRILNVIQKRSVKNVLKGYIGQCVRTTECVLTRFVVILQLHYENKTISADTENIDFKVLEFACSVTLFLNQKIILLKKL